MYGGSAINANGAVVRLKDRVVDRRDFLKAGAAAVVGTVAASSGAVAAAPSTAPPPIAIGLLGKTGRELPILGYGGAALPKVGGNSLSIEDRRLLSEYCARAYESDALKKMRID